MTDEDLKILIVVSRRICGYALSMNGARSDFRTRSLSADRRDARAMALACAQREHVVAGNAGLRSPTSPSVPAASPRPWLR